MSQMRLESLLSKKLSSKVQNKKEEKVIGIKNSKFEKVESNWSPAILQISTLYCRFYLKYKSNFQSELSSKKWMMRLFRKNPKEN
jgi:hypothetical protein